MAIRIGTYNARFLPHLPSNARRAEVLADRIRDGGYDLILLTEVFSGRARRILVGKLARDYPWNVQYIGSKRMLREDSGLMLLSRLPFDALPASSRFHHPRVRASGSGTTPDWTHVWFVEYTDCSHSDCLAGKGAGYVRARLGGKAVKIFFTHMQARYDHHSPRKQARTRDIRRAQLQQLADLVREALGADGDPGEPAIILGDFNVDGARSADGYSPPSGPDGDEWWSMLEHLNGLFRDGVIDVWDRYAPGADPGHTFSTRVPHARRDYVLMSATDPALPLSVHHAALAYNLASSNGQLDHHMSDHLGINVDLNLPQAGCHPMDAHSVAGVGGRMTVDGRIQHVGGLQWYRLDARGTFDVELGLPGANPTAALEVYDGQDISRPLNPAAADGAALPAHCRRYVLNGEAFIRVGIPRSGLSGEYSLRVAPVP